jgi:alkylation response protein AidB-like acyl-CoA dehydrogenase
VPLSRTFVRRPDDPTAVRRRGGSLFGLPRLSAVTYEHAGIAYGLGRRALTLLQQATDPQSGHPGLASRGDVLADIGRFSTRLAAAGAWVASLHDGILEDIEAGVVPDPSVATTAQASACHATEVAVEICTALFRYSGARGLYVPNEVERLFRDVNAAAEHVVVGNHVYLDQARIPYANVERS